MKGPPAEARELLGQIFATVGEILAVEADDWSDALPAGRVRAVPIGELEAQPVDGAAGALLAGWDEDGPQRAAARALACLRSGGVLAVVAPTKRSGLRHAVLSALSRRRAVLYEELCEALLLAGLVEVAGRELDGAAGWSIVWGRVPSA